MESVLAHGAVASVVVLAAVFLVAGTLKLRSFAIFRERLADFELVRTTLVSPIAWLIVVSELWVGVLVLARPSVGALAAATVLLLFAAVIAVTWLRGKRGISCGCFGQSRDEPIGWHIVVRDVGLAALAIPVTRLDLTLPASELFAGTVAVALYVLMLQVLAEAIRMMQTVRAQRSTIALPDGAER